MSGNSDSELLSHPYISVLIPVFNEEPNLEELYKRLKQALDRYGKSYELLFIDDGSTDNSYEVLRGLHSSDSKVRAIKFARNFGQQMAIAAGLKYSRGDVVVLIDADLQTMPEEIPKLVDKLLEGYDIVYGIRQRRKDPLLRRIGSWCMSHLLYRITNIEIPDSASGFLALNRTFVDSINLFNEKSKYFSGLFAWLSYGRWGSVPVTHAPRRAGVSKYSIPKLIGLTLNFVCNFTTLPLRFAFYTGGVLAMIGGAAFAVILALRLLGILGRLPAVETLGALIILCTGLQIFFIGIVGEYLGRVYVEVKERPPYVVKEVLDAQVSGSHDYAGN